MTNFFFFGTLCHDALLTAVLGHSRTTEPAVLTDHGSFWVSDQIFPTIMALPDGSAPGRLLCDVTPEEAARLDFYEIGYGYETRTVSVQTGTGAREAEVYFPAPGLWEVGAPFNVVEWGERFGDVVSEAAREVMAGFGRQRPEDLRARYPQILSRAASRLRAAKGAPVTLRRKAGPEDVQIADLRQPYAQFFAVEEAELRFRRFDGALSDEVARAVFVSCDAAMVLPYDPVRDRVMVIEQFRVGAFLRGDSQPWVIEAIAGRVDPFETPEACARREAVEEAGIALQDLHPASGFYSSPGAKTEYVYAYVGVADLPDTKTGQGGLDEEAEDIRSHVIAFDDLMALISSGEVQNGPLILTALWLAQNRARLRRGG